MRIDQRCGRGLVCTTGGLSRISRLRQASLLNRSVDVVDEGDQDGVPELAKPAVKDDCFADRALDRGVGRLDEGSLIVAIVVESTVVRMVDRLVEMMFDERSDPFSGTASGTRLRRSPCRRPNP